MNSANRTIPLTTSELQQSLQLSRSKAPEVVDLRGNNVSYINKFLQVDLLPQIDMNKAIIHIQHANDFTIQIIPCDKSELKTRCLLTNLKFNKNECQLQQPNCVRYLSLERLRLGIENKISAMNLNDMVNTKMIKLTAPLPVLKSFNSEIVNIPQNSSENQNLLDQFTNEAVYQFSLKVNCY